MSGGRFVVASGEAVGRQQLDAVAVADSPGRPAVGADAGNSTPAAAD